MRIVLAISLLAACTGEDDDDFEECRCVEYNVVSEVGFDHLSVAWFMGQAAPRWTEEHDTQPTNTFLVGWYTPWGSAPSAFSVKAFDAQGLVATGAADLEYEHIKDSSFLARGTLMLLPIGP